MLEHRFPQGKFWRHDPLGLIAKHSVIFSITCPYAHEKWDHEMPYENETAWEEVFMRLKSKYFTSSHNMTFNEQMERIKQKLVDVDRLLKKEEEENIKFEEVQSIREA